MAVRPSPAVAGFPPLIVHYNRRMKPSRVYPVTVRLSDRGKPIGAVKHVTVRLLGAGAQIVPTEQVLDVTRPELRATFFVTPLATGWMRAQRVEVLVNGRKVQEVPLASKVVTHRGFKLWLALAIALPILLTWLASADPGWLRDFAQNHVPILPLALTEKVPALETGWNHAWTWLGNAFADVNQFLKDRVIVFPTLIVCLLLALWSAFIHRDRGGKRWSKPIAVPVSGGED